MKENKVAKAVGLVNDKYINEAISYKPKKSWKFAGLMGLVAAAACAMLLIGLSVSRNSLAVDSVVALDINPSIELTVSKNDKVLSAVALNEDAEIVLEGMDLKNVDLDTAMNAIIGSLLKNGYLDEVYNAINICVENNDSDRATELGDKIKNEISEIFDENDLLGGVNTQICPEDEDDKALAKKYGVSVGKLALAQTVANNTNMELEDTVKLSISELWELLCADNLEIITKDEALDIAAKDAGVDADKLVLVSNKIRESAGLFTFDIEFTVDETAKYKYEIDAMDGTVLKRAYETVVKEEEKEETPSEEETQAPEEESESEKETQAPEDTKPAKHLTKKEVLAIAYEDAVVQEADVKLKRVHHKPVEKEYHIEFSVGMCDYSYVINAVDGSIISKEADETDVDKNESDTVIEAVITAQEALTIALEKAGAELADLTKYDIKYTAKKDSAEYKVHFHVGKTHYDYTVDAVTGELVEKVHPTPGLPHEKEEHVKPEAPTAPVPPHQKEEAKPVAPHEKSEDKPVGPLADKEANKKPVGPNDSKVTIAFEKETNN